MTNDPRLRARLRRLADDVEPDGEDRLARTVGMARRRARIREIGTVAFETLAVAAVAVAVLVLANGRPAEHAGTSTAPGLAGSWTTTIDASNPELATAGMVGTWSLGFPSTGVLEVEAPPQFTAPRTGYAFQVTGDTLRTDLLGESVCSGSPPGTYRFAVTGSDLRFTLVDDACGIRVSLLTASPWTRATGMTGGG